MATEFVSQQPEQLEDVPETAVNLSQDSLSEELGFDPQDSVEDHTEEAVGDDLKEDGTTTLKKKSLVRSFKKGASKRYKAIARKSKEVTQAFKDNPLTRRLSFNQSRTSTGRDSQSEDMEPNSVRSGTTDNDGDNKNDTDMFEVSAVKIQKAYRSFSEKKQQVKEEQIEQKRQEDAATKIQAGVRGYLARAHSVTLKEQQAMSKAKSSGPKKLLKFVLVAGIVAVGGILIGKKK
eukprot:TRINITY_DN4825_c0_g1_i2.p2 TRINITY_DN4825_c0_g1~~TRINITY_DN4825_c0_g1_i2.p2  ORF type:complete len:266 (-),score=46.66 TRINITY_DN4825_c0_g1_i2:1877-2578(-)